MTSIDVYISGKNIGVIIEEGNHCRSILYNFVCEESKGYDIYLDGHKIYIKPYKIDKGITWCYSSKGYYIRTFEREMVKIYQSLKSI